jgi:hypothetical protein
MVEYSLDTSMTQSISDIETGLLDQNLSLLLFLYLWSQEWAWICNPSFQIYEEYSLHTFLFQGIFHHASAILIVPSNSA